MARRRLEEWRLLVGAAQRAGTCRRCGARRSTTLVFCVGCVQVLCPQCAGLQPHPLCELQRCVRCVADGLPVHLMREVMAALDRRTRKSTRENHARHLRAYRVWALGCVEGSCLPARPVEILLYVMYCLERREPVLDATTVQLHVTALSAWHQQAQEAAGEGSGIANPSKDPAVRRILKVALDYYKKPSKAMRPFTLEEWMGVMQRGFPSTRSGRHRLLGVTLCATGPFRPGAVTRMKVHYTVGAGGRVFYGPKSDIWVVRDDPAWPDPYLMIRLTADKTEAMDKNVTASRTRDVPIPARCMGTRPVRLLENYLRHEAPPTGGYLMVAPLGREGFRTGRYSNLGKAVTSAYKRAWPGRSAAGVAGATPRKSMAQWLWRAGRSKREIVDIAGWAQRDRDAADVYFKTQCDVQLHIKEALLHHLRYGRKD